MKINNRSHPDENICTGDIILANHPEMLGCLTRIVW